LKYRNFTAKLNWCLQINSNLRNTDRWLTAIKHKTKETINEQISMAGRLAAEN
jgi:hypothetical protein